jgi:perosamine synthetase
VIPVYEPWLTDLEKSYAKQAIDSTWISSNGQFIKKAEGLLGEFFGSYAKVTNNGTTALHLCCRIAGMKPGDVVIVPACTYAATAFAAIYCGANVKFVDSDPFTWNMDLDIIEDMCRNGSVDYVIAVHLLGNPVNMPKLMKLAEKYGFKVIEDACESIGAEIDGVPTGKFGTTAAFSFYGNKTFTSGEGGAVIASEPGLIQRAEILRGQGQSLDRRYWHLEIGHNYRMTNIQAAILCAQLERANEILEAKQKVAKRYLSNFEDAETIRMQDVCVNYKHSYWMIAIKTPVLAESLATGLRIRDIDSRPMFYPLNEMPPFHTHDVMPVSKSLSDRCLMLPSSPTLTDSEIDLICGAVVDIVNASARSNSIGPI